MAKLKNPITFTTHFGLAHGALAVHGALDPVLNIDTRLFIDPLLLSSSSHPEMRAGKTRFDAHFTAVASLLAHSTAVGDVAWRNAARKLSFREMDATCLGYGQATTAGRAGGKALSQHVIQTAKEIVDIGVRDPELFLALALFEDGIGPDLISDMTTNVIWRDLADYTARVSGTLSVPLEDFLIDGVTVRLPRNPTKSVRSPILLVPKDVLRELPVALDWDGVASAASANDELRHKLNAHVSELWAVKAKRDKAELRRQLLGSKDAISALIEVLKNNPGTAYDSVHDPKGLLAWHVFVRKALEVMPASLTALAGAALTIADVKTVARTIVERFQYLVEQKGLAKELWASGSPRPEKSAQRLFFAVADAYCRLSGVDVTPEADSGAGPVDFKFSAGYHNRVLVELKLSTNPKVVAGYSLQLEAYKNAEETTEAFYVVIDVGSMGHKDATIVALRNAAVGEGKKVSEIVFIDGEVRPSASHL